MRSFVSALIAIAVATLNSAAPIGLPSVNPTVSVSALSRSLPSVHLPAGIMISPGEGEVKSGVKAVRADDSTPKPPSVAVIFDNILTEIEPLIEQLTYLAPVNCTITEITAAVASINASISAALPQLEALVGLEASTILGTAGDVELTASQVATTVGSDLLVILHAVGNVLNVTTTHGGEIATDAKKVLTDLGCAITNLVNAVEPLIDGLSTFLAPVVAPVESVVSDLDLVGLAIALGLIV